MKIKSGGYHRDRPSSGKASRVRRWFTKGKSKQEYMAYKTPFVQKDMTGTLWLEPKTGMLPDGKEVTSYSGSALIHGVEMWINAYLKDTKTGKKMLSLTFKPKVTGTNQAPTQTYTLGPSLPGTPTGVAPSQLGVRDIHPTNTMPDPGTVNVDNIPF